MESPFQIDDMGRLMRNTQLCINIEAHVPFNADAHVVRFHASLLNHSKVETLKTYTIMSAWPRTRNVEIWCSIGETTTTLRTRRVVPKLSSAFGAHQKSDTVDTVSRSWSVIAAADGAFFVVDVVRHEVDA